MSWPYLGGGGGGGGGGVVVVVVVNQRGRDLEIILPYFSNKNIFQVIRPLDQQPSSFDPRCFVDVLYATTLKRLKAADLDQEVKERAIASMAQIVANAGSKDKTKFMNEILLTNVFSLSNNGTPTPYVKLPKFS